MRKKRIVQKMNLLMKENHQIKKEDERERVIDFTNYRKLPRCSGDSMD